jgi:membrane-bound lytic murein transglycosylase D
MQMVLKILLLILFLNFNAYAKEGDPSKLKIGEFEVPYTLEGRVGFWRDIFTKYGKNHRVFHHREHPEIVYSVLDFSEISEEKLGGKSLEAREDAVEQEISRIKSTLGFLATGNTPRNNFEKRIVALFQKYTEPKKNSGFKDRYLEAAEEKAIRYQTGIRERFRDGVVRSGRYMYAIERIFSSHGLPKGIARLPLVESSFDYTAYSSVGAAGIWQFTRSTGQKYLKISSSLDERRDPILATRAAAAYLSNSYNRTQNWPLAITSYNHGLQGILNAANAVGSKDLAKIIKHYDGPGFGFASGNFYCEFLAALDVELNAELYFPGIKRESPWYFDEVRLGRSLYIKDLARYVGLSKEEIAELNLGFREAILKNNVSIPAGSVIKLPPNKSKNIISLVSSSSKVYLEGGLTKR